MATATALQHHLSNIKSPADLKALAPEDLPVLAGELRECLIDTIPRIGGHFASNLGNVELAIALHYVFKSPRDAIVWDVSHGAYAHKLLTGRLERLTTLRQEGGLSGFLSPAESEHDWASTGHAGTALSTAMGIAWARKYSGKPGRVVAVVGDGSLPSGMSLEALNNLGSLGVSLMIVLNDNQWSIDPTPGALARVLAACRESGCKGRFFEDLGIRYVGPVSGHDLTQLLGALEEARSIPGAVLVHAVTRKGKGYLPAEQNPLKFHSISPPNPGGKAENAPTYSSVFASTLAELASRDPRIVAISAGMLSGTGLEEFRKLHPGRCFDVGIAEEHAVTFAAGLALQGMRPVVAIYSTFLQRAYDQIVHDVCLPGLPVVFAIDRAGAMDVDGPTHHGVFDIAYLRHLPNMRILSPSSAPLLRRHLEEALLGEGPVAIRYPRGAAPESDWIPEARHSPPPAPPEGGRGTFGESRLLRRGEDIGLMVTGAMVRVALDAAKILAERAIEVEVLETPSLKPLDRDAIREMARRHSALATLEDHVVQGGFGSAVAELLVKEGSPPLAIVGWPDRFVEAGPIDALRRKHGLHPEGIAQRLEGMLQGRPRATISLPSVTHEEARRLMDEVRAMELSPALSEARDGYEKVGLRNSFLWRWVRHGVEITTLSCVPQDLKDYHCDTKALGVVFDVLLDDIADKRADREFLESLISITEGKSPACTGLSEADREYLEFTRKVWHWIQDRILGYPRFSDFRDLLDYDYRQLMNVMRYSALMNGHPAIMNLEEHNAYLPHNMHMMVSSTMDLMASPRFDVRELGRLREVIWFAQQMGRIGNLVTTWEREVSEKDYSSGIFAAALADGILDLDDLKRGDEETILKRIRQSDLEGRFLHRWRSLREEILRRAHRINTVDVQKLVDGLDRLIRLHLGSRGLK